MDPSLTRFPAKSAAGRAWYRVDLHVHSALSAGADQSPEQLIGAARVAGLDVIAITDHNTTEAHAPVLVQARDELLVILGQEVVTATGHWLALGIGPGQLVDWHYRVRDQVIERHLEPVHRAGGLCVAAHPVAPYPGGMFGYSYQGFDAVEVWNGLWRSDQPWNADNESALAEWGRTLATGVLHGSWRPAVGNSDAHLEGQLGVPHNVVLAEELSVDAVLAAVRKGHSWITESTDVGFSMSARSGEQIAGLGESLPTFGASATVRVEITGVPAGQVSFHTDRGTAQRYSLPATGSGTVRWVTSLEESAFVRVEVRHPDGRMATLSNPILFT